MDGDRAFKNAFPDYDGSKFSLDKNKQLQGAPQSQILFNIEKLLKILDHSAVDDGKDYSVYTGSSGHALLHLHLHTRLPSRNDGRHLQIALNWLKPCLSRLKGSKPSLLCGDSGPLAIAAVLFDRMGDKKKSKDYVSRVEAMCEEVCSDKTLPDEILFGRCGYLSSLLFLQRQLGHGIVHNETISKVVEAVLNSGTQFARRERCQQPLMYEWHDKPYLGAAHGLAGIYFMLLQVQEPNLQEHIHQIVRPCIDYMLTLRFASGNCPSSLGSSSGDKLVHWCHGAPGWVHMFALAYKIYKDKRYLEAAKQCGHVVWQRGLLLKGYGICHGTAGNAYTFLTLYKLTEDHRYLYYAYKFAEWCFDYGKHGCRTPDRPFSLFEGMAGTVYFLADMLEPATSAFPAFDYQV